MRIGVDLGGTKIEVAVLEDDGAVVFRERRATPKDDYAGVLERVAALVARAREVGGDVPVGIGIPGSLSPRTGLVRNANSTVLNGRPVDRDLAAALARPVRIENDANCFAIAEAREGAGRDARVVLGLILGTGIGAGIAMDGECLIGRNRIGGEWGHNPLPRPHDDERPGPDCYCGRQGCIETWCSGPAIEADHYRRTGRWVALPELAELSDHQARETLSRHTDRLARSLGGVVNVLDPDVIVLGGGLSNLPHLSGDLAEALPEHVFSDCFDTPIRRNELGDSAGVIGAAWLWPSRAEVEGDAV